jgi:hypothetical protein
MPARGPKALPTREERTVLTRQLKREALAGNVDAAAALATLELTSELRRARNAPTAPINFIAGKAA